MYLVGFTVGIVDKNSVGKNQLAMSFEGPKDDNIQNSISFSFQQSVY